MSKMICTGWPLTLLLALGCAGRTLTEVPAPAGNEAAPQEVERVAELEEEHDEEPESGPGSDEATMSDPAAPGQPVTVTDANFEQVVLRSSMPVLVDIWADWCPPCRALAPIMEDLAAEYRGRAIVAKLDHDANPVIPDKYGVENLPTMILFKDGQPVITLVGLKTKQEIAHALDSVLGG